jgi:hypothetical protein
MRKNKSRFQQEAARMKGNKAQTPHPAKYREAPKGFYALGNRARLVD